MIRLFRITNQKKLINQKKLKMFLTLDLIVLDIDK